MCGIAGVLNLDGESASPVILKHMADAIAHRGPDSEGFWAEGAVGLAHRRLSIIDLSPAGHQPMISRSGDIVLTYNGEVYNFQELRVELEALGHQFRSRTDSEVVLNAWMEWGAESVKRLNGMFAFAVWDKREQTLFLARDRYGIKPLYYARWGNTIAFGSEQKALLQHPRATRKLNTPALYEYFTFQNIFTEQTLLEHVNILPQGTIATIPLGAGGKVDIRPYWDYHFREPDGPVDEREYEEELARLLHQAVSRQLVSDVELGSYLSGGLDSGSLSALASSQLSNLKTFTCGFDLSSASGVELGFDERAKAEAMSALYKTEHYEMVLKAGDMERCLPKLAYHIEEPRVGQSYPNYYAAHLASKFVKVVLSGAGGDELFGGYPWRYYRASDCDSFEHYIEQYYGFWQRMLSNQEQQSLFAPIWSEVRDVQPLEIFSKVFATHENELEQPSDYINHSLYFEAKTFLHGLFVIEDKLSMAHSLETRVPFMDNELVDFAMRCPVNLKLNNLAEVARINENTSGSKRAAYFSKTRDGKQILRNVISRYVPEDIASGVKQGFSSPDASWFKGDSIEYVKDSLLGADAEIYQWLDRKTVSDLIGEHLQGKNNRRLLIWSLLNFEQWLKAYL